MPHELPRFSGGVLARRRGTLEGDLAELEE